MDVAVSGRRPTSTAGRVFRLDLISWHALHAHVVALCPDLITAEVLDRMLSLQRDGPQNPAACREMAQRFATWLAGHPGGYARAGDTHVSVDGRQFGPEELKKYPWVPAMPLFAVSAGELRA